MTIIFSSQPFYGRYVQRSTPDDPVSPNIYNNSKLWPFFQGCLGAIDGSHMPISPPTALQSLYRNRKGFLSQNCLFICNFTMLFTYILTGWEGSATDSRVWADALAKGFSVPEGFYYLADAGYPHCKELLTPFRGVRYHLQEWGAAGIRYVFCDLSTFSCSSYNNFIAQQMQRSYSTFVMLKHAMSLSVFLEFSSSASKFSFSLLIIHLTSRLAFLSLYALSRISFK